MTMTSFPYADASKGGPQMTVAAAPSFEVDEDLDAPTWLRADALCLAGFASLGAGAIHAVAIGVHSSSDQAMYTFMAVASLQLVWGVLAVARSSRVLAIVGALFSAALFAGWVVAKRSGLGFIEGLEAKASTELSDGIAAGLAFLVVVLATATALRPSRRSGLGQRVATSVACLAVVLLVLPGMSAAARPAHHSAGAGDAVPGQKASAVAPVPYDPAKPIDLGGVDGVSEAQQARAENLIASTLGHLPQFADPADAEAAGFKSIQDGGTGYEHYINSEYRSDGKVLDPDRPESLVYQVRGGEKELVAAMYMAEPGTTLDTTPDIGGALTQWHIHDNLCFTPGGQVAGITDAEGNCAPSLVKFEPVPMIHVWIVPHPCGPFAALDGIAGGSIKPGEERLCDTAHGH